MFPRFSLSRPQSPQDIVPGASHTDKAPKIEPFSLATGRDNDSPGHVYDDAAMDGDRRDYME